MLLGKKSGGKGGDKKKWQNVNKDGKSEMKKDGTIYCWCKTCGCGKGRWVDSHKSEDCRYRKNKTEETSGENTEEVEKEILLWKLISADSLLSFDSLAACF